MGAIRRATKFNLAAPGANTAILTSNLTPAEGATLIRVGVALAAGSVFNITATDGATAHKWGLNASAALQAADYYSFEVVADRTLAYNFEVETDGIIELLIVDDIVEPRS